MRDLMAALVNWELALRHGLGAGVYSTDNRRQDVIVLSAFQENVADGRNCDQARNFITTLEKKYERTTTEQAPQKRKSAV